MGYVNTDVAHLLYLLPDCYHTPRIQANITLIWTASDKWATATIRKRRQTAKPCSKAWDNGTVAGASSSRELASGCGGAPSSPPLPHSVGIQATRSHRHTWIVLTAPCLAGPSGKGDPMRRFCASRVDGFFWNSFSGKTEAESCATAFSDSIISATRVSHV